MEKIDKNKKKENRYLPGQVIEGNVMKNCEFEDFIDDYLLSRLGEGKEKGFEEHYFNCPCCFVKMVERQELISIVRNIRN
ncbi:hypothetical protein LCGC14_1285460 [marine sediment metagenome]|uniref:Zinc-finger domain-containing protein n=1 Tax=marine sediment metagenome TaxID=412755 RepID=A0A0F9NX40_9ZZZZ